MGETNFSYLLIALLIVLVTIALVDDFQFVSAPVARVVIFSGLLVVGVWSLKGSGRFFSLGMAFVVAGLVSAYVSKRSEQNEN